jgi:hypothetical protein
MRPLCAFLRFLNSAGGPVDASDPKKYKEVFVFSKFYSLHAHILLSFLNVDSQLSSKYTLAVDNIQVQQDISYCTWWRRPRQLRAHPHICRSYKGARHSTPLFPMKKELIWDNKRHTNAKTRFSGRRIGVKQPPTRLGVIPTITGIELGWVHPIMSIY